MLALVFLALFLTNIVSSNTPYIKVIFKDGSVKKDNPVFVRAGEGFRIICHVKSEEMKNVTMYFTPFGKNKEKLDDGMYELTVTRKTDEIRLNHNSISLKNSGNYACKVNGKMANFDLYVYSFSANLQSSIQLNERQQTINEYEFTELNIDPSENKAEIVCQAQTRPEVANKFFFKWSGPGLIFDSNRFHKTFEVFPNGTITSSLILNTPTTERSLYGNYSCQLEYELTNKVETKTIGLSIPPVISKSSAKSETKFTNENFTFKCDIFYIGERPDYDLTWLVDKKPLPVDEKGRHLTNDRISLIKDENGDFSTIQITNLTMQDRSVYSCHLNLTTVGKTDVKAIFLRVKDENRKIWPLIGIGIELAVLFIIIIVAEIKSCHKKRVQRQHAD